MKILQIVFSCLAGVAATVMPHQENKANASIRGLVYDNRFGLPVSDAKVTIVQEGAVQQLAKSDRHGVFEIKNLA